MTHTVTIGSDGEGHIDLLEETGYKCITLVETHAYEENGSDTTMSQWGWNHPPMPHNDVQLQPGEDWNSEVGYYDVLEGDKMSWSGVEGERIRVRFTGTPAACPGGSGSSGSGSGSN